MTTSRTDARTVRTARAAEPTPPGTVRKAENTRRQILDAALAEFAAKGFSGTRTATIAERAKVNKQALYYYFGSKEDLFQSVLESGYSAIYQRIRAQLKGTHLDEVSPTVAVGLLLEIYFDTMLEFQQTLDVIADENRHKGSHLNGLTSIRLAAQPFFVTLRRVLKRGAEDGSFRRNVDPVHTWMAIISLSQFWWTHRYTVSHILARDITSPTMVQERRKQVIAFVLAALSSPGSQTNLTTPAGR